MLLTRMARTFISGNGIRRVFRPRFCSLCQLLLSGAGNKITNEVGFRKVLLRIQNRVRYIISDSDRFSFGLEIFRMCLEFLLRQVVVCRNSCRKEDKRNHEWSR